MDIFKFLGGLFGGKKKEEEERARQAALQPRPAATAPRLNPKPPPAVPVQQPLRQLATPASQLKPPQPIAQAMKPVVNPTQKPVQKPAQKPPLADQGDSNFLRSLADSTIRHITSGNAGREAMNNKFVQNVGLPVAAGANNAATGLLGGAQWAAEKINPSLKNLNDTQRRLSADGKTGIDRLQTTAKEASQLSSMSADDNIAKIPNWVPLFGGVPYAQLATEGFLDPFGRINPFKNSANRLLRQGVGPTSAAVASGVVQPAESEVERLQNAALSGGVSSILSAAPGSDPMTGLMTKNAPQRTLAAAEDLPPEIARILSESGTTLRDLNTQVQEQMLSSELNRLPREVREAASDVPANQRPPLIDDLDAIAPPAQRPIVDTPSIINEAPPLDTPQSVAPQLTIPQSMLRQLDEQNKVFNGRAMDTELDKPTFMRQQEAPGLAQALDEQQRIKQLTESEALAKAEAPTSTEPLIQTPDVAQEAAIPNAANALPENPAPIPPSSLSEAPPLPAQTGLSPEQNQSFAATNNQTRSIANTEAVVRDTLNGSREESRVDNDKIFAQVKSALGIDNPTPDTRVKMYRAGTNDIQPGDHVTVDRANAEKYQKQRPDSQIFEDEFTLKDLVRSGGLKSEFIYAPKNNAAVAGAPVQDLLQSLQRAELSRAELKPIRAQDKASRIDMGQRAYEDAGGGEKGYRAKLAELKGEYEKADFTPLDMKPESQQKFLDFVEKDPTLQPFEKLNTQSAFRKLWGASDDAPTVSDVRYMRNFLSKYIDDTTQVASPAAVAKATGAPDLGDAQATATNAKELVDAALNGVEEAAARYGKDWYDKLGDILSIPRTAMTTLDFSMGLRQGAPVAARYLPEWMGANTSSVGYAVSPESMVRDMKALAEHPDYNLINDLMKVRMPSIQGLNDEAMQAANIIGKVPVYGKLTDASARAYDGGLTKLRWNLAQTMIKNLGGQEKMLADFSPKEIRQIGATINTLTGYGDFGDGKIGNWVNKLTNNLGGALFAPKLWASRLQMLNPAFYMAAPAPARRMAIESMGSFLGVAGAVLSSAVLAANAMGNDDVSVSTDPLNSDFLKLKVGNTRFDILAGMQQNIVLLARQIAGAKTSSTTGERTELGGDYGDPSRFDLFVDTIVNKLNPLMAFGVNFAQSGPEEEDDGNPLTRVSKFGEEINFANEAGKMLVPLSTSSVNDLYQDTGDMMKTAMMAAPGFFGVGIQTYGDIATKDTEARQAVEDEKNFTEDLKARGIPNPYDYQGENTFDQEVQRYRESDNFTIVAEALEHKLAKQTKEGAPKKDLDKIQQDIDIARVAEKNAIKYSDLALYYGAISGVDSASTITNTEFKRLIDPEDELYNMELAEKIYQIDTWMAEAGVSSNTTDRSKNYYTIPKAKAGGRGGRASRGGDLSSPINLRGLSLNSLTADSLPAQKIPTIKPLSGRSLTVKPRRITVS